MPPKFDDKPHAVSDIPEGHLGGLTWEEAKMVAEHRFVRAGEPHDRLKAWLDDHQVYPKREENAVRVYGLDWFQMLGLVAEIGLWVQEHREEADPPRADLG
jgi:hypothetical protein